MTTLAGLRFPDEVYEKNYIGGVWRFPRAPYEFDIRSPVTSDVLATIPLSSQFDVRAAVQSASDALSAWSDRATRLAVLESFYASLRNRAFDLASLQSLETGLHREDSLSFAGALIEMVSKLVDQQRNTKADQSEATTGVEGVILGWSAPLVELGVAVLPPLSSGSTLVVKPSMRAPLTVAAVTSLFHDAGLAPGALNLVQGLGTDVGSAIAASPDVAQVTVRGSRDTIESVARATSRHGGGCKASNGGSQVLLVGHSAVAEDVVFDVVRGLRANSFGGPLAYDTVVVPRSSVGEVIEAIAEAATTLGAAPVPTARIRMASLRSIREILDGGGILRLGGPDLPADAHHRMGWFQPPTIIEVDASNGHLGSRLAGPALLVVAWDTEGDIDKILRRHGDGTTVFTAGIGPIDLSLDAKFAAPDTTPSELLFEGSVASGWLNRSASDLALTP